MGEITDAMKHAAKEGAYEYTHYEKGHAARDILARAGGTVGAGLGVAADVVVAPAIAELSVYAGAGMAALAAVSTPFDPEHEPTMKRAAINAAKGAIAGAGAVWGTAPAVGAVFGDEIGSGAGDLIDKGIAAVDHGLAGLSDKPVKPRGK